MKRHYWLIATIFVIVVAIVVPLGLYAQSREIPPPPPLPQPESGKEFRHPSGEIPTATPNPEEAERLSPVPPSEKPETEAIDTAPEVDRSSKYELVITRGKTDKRVLVFIPVGTPPDEFIDKYVNQDDGDTYYVGAPSIEAPPAQDKEN